MSDHKFELGASYGKQSVPVFKVIKNETGRHTVLDMQVQVMLTGQVEASWLEGRNHQIVPTETQKNTCYAIALQTDFSSPEEYAIHLGRDLIRRHGHLAAAEINIDSRRWDRVIRNGVPHHHAFTAPAGVEVYTCAVRVARDQLPVVSSGVKALRLLKTTQSGFDGFIVDKYTNLEPVGAGSANPDRIMCTELESTWHWDPTAPPVDYNRANDNVCEILRGEFAGPAPGGIYSKSLQETVYRMATTALGAHSAMASIELTTPNIHFYRWNAEGFGLENPNIVFQKTDSRTSASGRIMTVVSRKDDQRSKL